MRKLTRAFSVRARGPFAAPRCSSMADQNAERFERLRECVRESRVVIGCAIRGHGRFSVPCVCQFRHPGVRYIKELPRAAERADDPFAIHCARCCAHQRVEHRRALSSVRLVDDVVSAARTVISALSRTGTPFRSVLNPDRRATSKDCRRHVATVSWSSHPPDVTTRANAAHHV